MHFLGEEGINRFKHVDKDPEGRPSFSKVIKVLKEIKYPEPTTICLVSPPNIGGVTL